MLIVSQDKKSIYNFNNMKSLDLVGNQIFVTDNTLADEGVRIGKYRTKERAQDILDEIKNYYTDFETAKIFVNQTITQEILEKLIKEGILFDVYEMPEE